MNQEPVTPPTEPVVPPPVVTEPPVVEPDPAFKRMKDDLHKSRTRAQELEDENKRLKEEKLKATKNWEEIAKLKEGEAEQEKQRRVRLEQAIIDRDKIAALRIEAQKAGIHQNSISDLDLLDFPEIDIETTSNGKIIVHGAEQAIAGLKLKRPHWFSQKPPSVNPASPETIQGSPSEMTPTAALKLEAAYRKNPTRENKQNYENALRKLKGI